MRYNVSCLLFIPARIDHSLATIGSAQMSPERKLLAETSAPAARKSECKD